MSFFAAFAFLWYSSVDRVVIISVSIAVFAFVVVLAWAMSTTYEKGPYVTYTDIAQEKVEDLGRWVRRATSSAVVVVKGSFSSFGSARESSSDVELGQHRPSDEDLVGRVPMTVPGGNVPVMTRSDMDHSGMNAERTFEEQLPLPQPPIDDTIPVGT